MARQKSLGDKSMIILKRLKKLEGNLLENEKNKTVVGWLIDNLPKRFQNALANSCSEEIERAKKMEKDQLEQCWNVAHQAGRFEGKGIAEENWQTFENYYEELKK